MCNRLQRFSIWHKVKVAVALFLKFKGKLREKVLEKRKALSNGVTERGSTDGTSTSPGLSVADLEEAEVEIIKQVQRGVFPLEMRSL